MEANLSSPQGEKKHMRLMSQTLHFLYCDFKKLNKKVLKCSSLPGLEIPSALTAEKVWHAQAW